MQIASITMPRINYFVVLLLPTFFFYSSGSNSKATFYNPIFDNYSTPDPFVYFHTDGNYYYSHSEKGRELIVFKSKSLTDFRNAENATVFICPDGLEQLWAPEIHFVQNNFYIYFTMKDETPLGHKMYVIQALDNTNPLGNYTKEIMYVLKNK
jgi:GH43 family beta-xylosidase